MKSGHDSSALGIRNIRAAEVHARSPNYFGTWASVSSFTTVTAIIWTGAAGDGEWNNPTNWNPRTVPSSYNHVSINSGTVYVPPNFSFQSLTLPGGAMQNSFTIIFNKLSDVDFNTLYGHAGITFNNEGTYRKLGGAGTDQLSDFTFNHTGTIEVLSNALDFKGNNTLNLSGNLVTERGRLSTSKLGMVRKRTLTGSSTGL